MTYKHPQLSDNEHDANYWLRRKNEDKAKQEADKRRAQEASGKPQQVNRTCRIRFHGNGMPQTKIYCSTRVASAVKDLTVMVRQNIHVPQRGKNDALVKRLASLAAEESELHNHFTKPGKLVILTYAESIFPEES